MPARFPLFALAMGLLLVAGCARPSPIAPVRGRVTCEGEPVPGAAITFSPIPGDGDGRVAGKPATGFTDNDGYYVLSTHREYDGALIGVHRVSVTPDDNRGPRCKPGLLVLEVNPETNELGIKLTPKPPREQPPAGPASDLDPFLFPEETYP